VPNRLPRGPHREFSSSCVGLRAPNSSSEQRSFVDVSSRWLSAARSNRGLMVLCAACQCLEGTVQAAEWLSVPDDGPPHLPQLQEVDVPEERQQLWVERGGLELDPTLASGAMLLVDAGWLVQLARSGGTFLPRQTLPAAAFTPHSMVRAATQQIPETSKRSFKTNEGVFGEILRIACVSHCWLQSQHPDPRGYNLRVLARALALLCRSDMFSSGTWATCLDFCCLHQCCRDREGMPQQRSFKWLSDDRGFENRAVGRFAREETLFREALDSLGSYYSHPKIIVLMLTQFPPDYDDPGVYDGSGNVSSYMDRGWCFFEFTCATMVKYPTLILDLGRATGAEDSFLEFVGEDVNRISNNCLASTCATRRSAPVTSEAFEASLESKRFTTDSVDRLRVAKLYSNTLASRIHAVEDLNYHSRGWGDSEAGQVADLIACGTPNLVGLTFYNNRISDSGLARLADALAAPGGPQNLQGMFLNHNAVGDQGAARLAEAAAAPGALKALRAIVLAGNRVGDEGAARLAAVAAMPGTLPALEVLNLEGNVIGDRGAQSLAESLAFPGALPALKRLVLSGNAGIGEAGREALHVAWAAASRPRGGEFPSVRNLQMLQAGLFV
ncbi:unnamed protein product, partial [Prorocentrum cordatum]